MISQIRGKISRLTDESVTIYLNGMYYELMIPSGIFDRLQQAAEANAEITLYTLYYIEAGDRKSYHYPRLVGFTNLTDKEFFQLFTTVPGLGVKRALKSLTMPIKEIAAAIENKEASTLMRLPGIGRRQADKVVAELSGKMARFALSRADQPLTTTGREKADMVGEAIEVLLQLQYNRVAAEKMIDRAMRANPGIKDAEELISTIFKLEAGRQGGIKS
jgi:Holliday junction DNA helicase RuvA